MNYNSLIRSCKVSTIHKSIIFSYHFQFMKPTLQFSKPRLMHKSLYCSIANCHKHMYLICCDILINLIEIHQTEGAKCVNYYFIS